MHSKQTTAGEIFGNTDVYLIDQILKGRYQLGQSILDTGFGAGRNLHYFMGKDFDLWGNDPNPEAVDRLKQISEIKAHQFVQEQTEVLSFSSAQFHHIICSAVLHFAKNEAAFGQMLAQMARVLKPGGSIFIRMSSVFGLEGKIEQSTNGHWRVNPGSGTFLLTQGLLDDLLAKNKLKLAEQLKTVLVLDEVYPRSMAVLVLEKRSELRRDS